MTQRDFLKELEQMVSNLDEYDEPPNFDQDKLDCAYIGEVDRKIDLARAAAISISTATYPGSEPKVERANELLDTIKEHCERLKIGPSTEELSQCADWYNFYTQHPERIIPSMMGRFHDHVPPRSRYARKHMEEHPNQTFLEVSIAGPDYRHLRLKEGFTNAYLDRRIRDFYETDVAQAIAESGVDATQFHALTGRRIATYINRISRQTVGSVGWKNMGQHIHDVHTISMPVYVWLARNCGYSFIDLNLQYKKPLPPPTPSPA